MLKAKKINNIKVAVLFQNGSQVKVISWYFILIFRKAIRGKKNYFLIL